MSASGSVSAQNSFIDQSLPKTQSNLASSLAQLTVLNR